MSATPADRVALIYAHNDIQARVAVFWDEASPDEWRAASEEDLAKFGHLLPCELTKSGALRPKPNLQDVFNEHPFMLRRFSRLG